MINALGAPQAWTNRTTVVGRNYSATDDTIRNLFANGEKGAFYDPLDLSSFFQNNFGTIAPVPTQPVGLMLDKKNGVSLLNSGVLDQEFLSAAAWFNTNTWVVANGAASATNVSNGLYQGNRIVPGKLYKATLTVDLISGELYLPYDGNSGNALKVSQSGTYTRYFFGAFTNFYAAYGIGFTGSVSNLSIVQVDGNHAVQNTAGLRPLFQTPPSRIQFNGVTDSLSTNFGEALTGCTVARAVPGVGALILPGQNMASSFVDTAVHCGLIIINRALTAGETLKITEILNLRSL